MKKVQNVAKNDSALEELCKRYENRGKTYSTSPESVKQQSREISKRSTAPKSYRVSGNENVNRYKSGASGNKKYMTDSDFANYYQARRDYVVDESVKVDSNIELQRIDGRKNAKKKNSSPSLQGRNDIRLQLQRQASVSNPKKKTTVIINENKPLKKESINKNTQKAKQIVKKVAKEWIPIKEVEEETVIDGAKINIPTKMILTIALIGISLLLIVAGTVLLSSAQRRCMTLENDIAKLDAIIEELSVELDKKNENADIEIFAKEELGMISQEHVRVEYINNKTDEVVVKGESSLLTSLIEWFFSFLK